MPTAMIWGASGGIGRALVADLEKDGWQVVAISREDGDGARRIQADVTVPHQVEAAVQSASFEVGEVDLWIYAAGDIRSAPTAEMTPETWDKILGANLTGAFVTTHYSLPLLAEKAQLVYIGAISERLRLPGLSAYAAAKSGLEAFAEALRKEQRKRRILVVRPGAVDTDFWDKVPLSVPKDAATPEKVSRRIIMAVTEGTTGLLDLN